MLVWFVVLEHAGLSPLLGVHSEAKWNDRKGIKQSCSLWMIKWPETRHTLLRHTPLPSPSISQATPHIFNQLPIAPSDDKFTDD